MHGLKYVKSYIHIYNCNDACPITISFAWTRILLLHYLTLTNLVWISFCCYTAQKMKFSIKDFFSTCDQIRKKLRIWSHLLKKSLMENFIFCAVLECPNYLSSLSVRVPKYPSFLSGTITEFRKCLQSTHRVFVCECLFTEWVFK